MTHVVIALALIAGVCVWLLVVSLMVSQAVGQAADASSASEGRSNDVYSADLVQGACITTSYASDSDDRGTPSFSAAGGLFRVVPCTTAHRAQLLAKVTAPLNDDTASDGTELVWDNWGSSNGPTTDQAMALVVDRCQNKQADVEETPGMPTGAVVRETSPSIGADVLGLCILDFGENVTGSWISRIAAADQQGIKHLAKVEAGNPTSVESGTCLADAAWPDANWHSIVNCTDRHRYSVFERVELPTAAQSLTRKELVSNASSAGASDSSSGKDSSTPDYLTEVRDFCEAGAAHDTGLTTDAGIPDAIDMVPAGAFYFDTSLVGINNFGAGAGRTTDAICSLAWVDSDGNSVPIREASAEFDLSRYYSASTADAALRCVKAVTRANRTTPDADLVVDCAKPHAYQLLSTFDARSLVTDDDIDDVVADDPSSALTTTFVDYCVDALQVALPGNSSAYVQEVPRSSSWSTTGTGDLPVDCYLKIDQEASLTTGSLFGS